MAGRVVGCLSLTAEEPRPRFNRGSSITLSISRIILVENYICQPLQLMLVRKLCLFGAALFFVAFVYFSYLVSQELFTQFNFDTTVKIQDRISRNWDIPFSILSLIGTLEITGLIWLAVVIFALVKRWFRTFFALGFLLPLSQILELYGKLFLLHPSPPFMFFRGTLPFNFPSGYIHTDYSYPSGHAIRTAFLIIFFIFLANRYSKGVKKIIINSALFVFLFSMLISRIYLGEHWTTDVIGGALLGLSLGLITSLAIPAKLT